MDATLAYLLLLGVLPVLIGAMALLAYKNVRKP